MRPLFLLFPALLYLAPIGAAQGAQSATADVNCGGIKIGEMKLTVDPYNFIVGAGAQAKRSFGAATTGGFQLTNAEARDANCWCESYRWFQAIDITANGINLGNGAPTFGHGAVTDPFPTTPVNWGGGQATGDFYPFYWGVPDGKCGHNSASGRNPIPGVPGKTWDLYYEDAPGLTLNIANAPANFSVTLDFATCLACVGTPLAGNGRNTNGSFKVLACLRWSVTMSRTPLGGWSSVIGAPVVVAPNALPAFVATSLTNFNNRPNVGTWTIGGACAPCPPPKIPTYGPPILDLPGIAFPVVPMDFDPASGMMQLPPMPPSILNEAGISAPTSPQYLGDPLFDGVLGSQDFRYMGFIGGQHLFMNDTNHMNLFADDPLDLPDQTLFGDPDFLGNPNGWETFITGHAPIMVYDEVDGEFIIPLMNPYLDPGAGLFMQDLVQGLAPLQFPMAMRILPLNDPLAATQGFTAPAQMQIESFLTPMEPPLVGQPYCPVNPNSSGQMSTLFATGSSQVQGGHLTFRTTQMPLDVFGFIVAGDGQMFIPNPGGSEGNLCVGPSLGRGVGDVIFSSGPFGASTVVLNQFIVPIPSGSVPVLPGQTWTFQTWHRDTIAGNATSNFSNAVEILFQ